MSSDHHYLALRLEGPLQSWGFDSEYNHRGTALMPTKSAIAGMCCAALGMPRGSEAEKKFLFSFQATRMTAIAIPRHGKASDLPVRRLSDYHTVQNTRRASGSINNDCVLTHRQYLCDSAFGVILKGAEDLLSNIAQALADPVWGLWLGRKTCIPTAPVVAGLTCEQTGALRLLIGEKPLGQFTHQEEVETFIEGGDSIPDQPVSFATQKRAFSLRRIRTEQGNGGVS